MLAMLPIDKIEPGDRLRGVTEENLELLQESIKEIGVLHPIVVYESNIVRDHVFVPGYKLVAGLHRLEACKRLGLKEIPAQIVTLSDLQRQLAECDENLRGPVLSVSERALFTTRRQDIYEALHPETRRGGLPGNKGVGGKTAKSAVMPPSFTADTAAKTGRSVRAVRLDAERGTKIAPEILEKIAHTDLDQGVVLDTLADIPKEQQPEKLAELRAKKEAKKAAKAKQPKRENLEAKLAALLVSKIETEHLPDIQDMLPELKGAKLISEIGRLVAGRLAEIA